MLRYLCYTFGISWSLWGLVILGIYLNIWGYGNPIAMLCYVLGAFAPAISAGFVSKKQCSAKEYKEFIRNIVNIKKPIKFYLFAIGLAFFLTILPIFFGGATIAKPIYIGFVLIIPMIIGGGIEEIGWRGFLQERMDKKFNSLISTLVISLIWAAWHIPLWFITWTNQSNWNFIFFVIIVISFSYILASVYHKTKSIFLCIICHASINAFWAVFPTNNKIFPMLPGVIVSIVIYFITIKCTDKK